MSTAMLAKIGRKTPPSRAVIPNMTPMVDVVMCILFFFMLGSSFLAEWYLKNQVPISKPPEGKGGIGLPEVRAPVRVTWSGGDTWVAAFGEPPLKMNRPGDTVRDDDAKVRDLFVRKGLLSPDVQLLLIVQREVPYQNVIRIYDCLAQAKFKQVGFGPADWAHSILAGGGSQQSRSVLRIRGGVVNGSRND